MAQAYPLNLGEYPGTGVVALALDLSAGQREWTFDFNEDSPGYPLGIKVKTIAARATSAAPTSPLGISFGPTEAWAMYSQTMLTRTYQASFNVPIIADTQAGGSTSQYRAELQQESGLIRLNNATHHRSPGKLHVAVYEPSIFTASIVYITLEVVHMCLHPVPSLSTL